MCIISDNYIVFSGMKALYNISAALLLILAGCTGETDEIQPPPETGYVPVYYTTGNITNLRYAGARPITQAGKQYVYGSLLLQNEINEGIHLIDISNPAQPRKLGFLQIPLCTEVAVKEGYLYTNNYDDLVVFNLNASGGPALVKRVENVFPPANQAYPPFFNVVFECPDPAKGIVIGWELKNNIKAKCRR